MSSGGASRLTAKRGAQKNTVISTAAAAIVAMVGITEMGPVGKTNADDRTPILSFADYERIYGGFTLNARDLPLSVRAFFDEVGENSGARVYISRVVHCTTLGDPTTKTSAKGSLDLDTASMSPTSGTVLSTNVGPYDLEPGDTLVVNRNVAGNATATFTATAAARQSGAGPFEFEDGFTLLFKIDGGATFTKTFDEDEFDDIGAVTAAQLCAVLNAYFLTNGLGALATVTSTTRVTITSTRRGTGSGVNIVSGTANAVLAFTTGNIAGTGNVSNINAVTVTEVITIVEAAVSGIDVTNESNALRITSTTDGATSLVQVVSGSTAKDEFGFDTAQHTGLAGNPETTLTLTAKWDGEYINSFTSEVTGATNGAADLVNLYLYKNGIEVEKWENANLIEGDAAYLVDLINNGGGGQKASRYVTATYVGTLTAPYNLPAEDEYGPFAGGDDGLTSLSDGDFYGASGDNGATGLRCFNKLRRVDDLGVPGRATATVQNQVVTYMETTRGGKSFATFGSVAGHTVAQCRAYVTTTASLKGLTEIARFAYPRIYVDNPAPDVYGTDATILAPNEGAIMGMHARISGSGPGGAFEQASGQELGFLRSVRGVETMEAEDIGKRGLLQDDNIAVIRSQDNVPHYLDGPDTLNSEGVFATVGESRGVNFVLNQIAEAQEPLLQKNINQALYSRLTNSATDFLEVITNAGRFRSRIYEEAFYVDYGPGLNPLTSVEAQEVNGRIGLNTSPSAKFINLEVVKFRPTAVAA